MKKALLSVVAAGLLSAGGFDNINNTNASKDDLLKQIQQLKKQLQQINEDIDDLNDRVDENELQSSLNRIKWGGELITRVGNFYGKAGGEDYANLNKWDMQLRLSMETRINPKTKFSGRLVMTKAWANVTPMYINYVDAISGKADGSNAVFVERAYIDYKITPNFIATIGRQPSSEGPGLSLKYDTPRKSTYPAILFNGQADGLVLTYKFKKNLRARLAYGKGYQWNDKNYGWVAKNPGIKDANVYAAIVEGNIKNSKLNHNLWILSAVRTTNLPSNPFVDYDASVNTSLGGYTHYGIYFENYHPLNSKFNYFLSYAYANPNPNSHTGYMDINGDGKPEAVQLLKKSGFAYHMGVRYDIKKNLKLGYEFNYGSKYWFSFSSNLTDPINKLATRGKVNDVYLIYNLDLNNLVRVGFTYVDYDYDGSGLYLADVTNGGEPQKVDDYYKLIYLTYDVRF
ncbi:MAG: DUF3373 domain-containing protein [Epsilonproteobacteria bacterium]|nr:DUF3373 domain-containing protein [Campylobacterota bacterium]